MQLECLSLLILENLVTSGCEYLLSRPANFLSEREIMGLVLTCHSKILVCHWLFLARAALERIKKQNKTKKIDES